MHNVQKERRKRRRETFKEIMTRILQNLVTILIYISTMVNKRNHGKQIYILTYHSENTKSKTRRKNLESSKREKKVYRVQEHLRKINI